MIDDPTASGPGDGVAEAIERAYRDDWVALVATLAGQVGGDIGLAEESVAEAFVAATCSWPDSGVPTRHRADGSPPSLAGERSTQSDATAPEPALSRQPSAWRGWPPTHTISTMMLT